MKPFIKKLLVAINGSQPSIQAAMYGIMMAKQYSCSIKAVFVVDTATIKFLTASKFFGVEEKQNYTEALNKDGNTYIDYVKKLAASKGVQMETELREGSVWAEVIKAADDFEADMILIGGHDNKNITLSHVEGRKSVAATARSEIVSFAHCPVLVIHKPEIEALFKIS